MEPRAYSNLPVGLNFLLVDFLFKGHPGVSSSFGGEASDGTVTVASQLRPAAQNGAVRVEGFNETHMSVLDAAAVSERVNEALSRAVR